MANDSTQLVTRFDDIYNLPDCRAYYRAMQQAGYRNAHYAVAAFSAALNELKRIRGLEMANLMDFASGYGIGALLLRHHVTLEQVLDRYQQPKFDDASTEEVIKWDRQWIEQNINTDQLCHIIGVDVAENALEYGAAVGIFDAAFAIDLQNEQPGQKLIDHLAGLDMIFEVGSVAHMLPEAMQKIIELTREKQPWIVTSPIRGNESEATINLLQDAGMVVEPMPVAPFQHRQFMDEAEKQRAIELVKSRGLDVDGYETGGAFHAQLYIARPENECTDFEDWLDMD